MSRIEWSAIGERFFEAGIDRGVLYVDDKPGVPWPGLTQVNETTAATDARQYYFDGVNYLNVAGKEEFKASLTAYYSPEEFDECDGSLVLSRGLIATQQRRKTFGLSYRTRIGNDLEGTDYGYKIHLIYNALASPAEHQYTSIAQDNDVAGLTWDLITKPQQVNGASPSAHFIIDASIMHPAQLALVEDALYGTSETDARLLTPIELLDLLEANYHIVEETNHYLDPGFEYGMPGIAGDNANRTFVRTTEKAHTGDYSLKCTVLTTGSFWIGDLLYAPVATDLGLKNGDIVTLSVWVWQTSPSSTYQTRPHFPGGNSTIAITNNNQATVFGEWQQIYIKAQIVDETKAIYARIYLPNNSPGNVVYLDDIGFSINGEMVDFNGDTPLSESVEPFGTREYVWAGEPGNSVSQRVISFGSIVAVNLYPDPSHEYGVAPFDSILNIGTGVAELDHADKHSGSHSVRVTNTSPTTALTENLMPDPSFEYGRGGWVSFSASAVTQSTAVRRSGNASLKFSGGTTRAGARINNNGGLPALKRNTVYTVSAWIFRTDTTIGAFFRYASGAALQPGVPKVGTGGWQRLSLTFTTTGASGAGADEIVIMQESGTMDGYMDDVSLVEGPDQPISSRDVVYQGRREFLITRGVVRGIYYYTLQNQTIHVYNSDWTTLFESHDISNDYAASTSELGAPLAKGLEILIPIRNEPNTIIAKWNTSYLYDVDFVSQQEVVGAPDNACSALAWDPVTNEYILTSDDPTELSIQRFDVNFNYIAPIVTDIVKIRGILYLNDRYYINGESPSLASPTNPLGRGFISINRDGSDPKMIINDPVDQLQGVCVGTNGLIIRGVQLNGLYFMKEYLIVGMNFNGDTPVDSEGNVYEWAGLPGESASRRFSKGTTPGRSILNIGTLESLGLKDGETFTWSCWVKITSGITPDNYLLHLIPGTAVTDEIIIVPPPERNEWVKVSGTTTVLDATQEAVWEVYAGKSTGDIIRYDDFAIQVGTETEDFNGDTLSTHYTPAGRFIYRWRGVPGNSISEKISSIV